MCHPKYERKRNAMRIQNAETLTSHGNTAGRKVLVEILEAGLEAADPYYNTLKLIRIEDQKLVVDSSEFEPADTPRTNHEPIDLSEVDRIYVFGAGKGIQRVAKALEDKLDNRLTGGHVIDKKGHELILRKIGVTLGGHPVPDKDCVKGCERILKMSQGLTKKDLVFTLVSNGVSSLLTMPVPGVSIEDVSQTTYVMQIQHGAPTGDLNTIRNHLDMMKGGRITKHLSPARMIHILAIDPGNYDQLMNRNLWLHTLPDCTTFSDAVHNLKKWDAWDEVPASVRAHLEKADPADETVKAKDFEKMNFRIFGVMPNRTGMMPTAMKKAAELGFKPVVLAEGLTVESAQAGLMTATIAKTIERLGEPSQPPCALFSGGEMLVTVGREKGIGGRNQEFALAAAQRIVGSRNIVVGSVDSDGTDGPGTQFAQGYEGIPCLAGGVVDGETMDEAQTSGVNVAEDLKRHNTSAALWKLKSGITATPNISLNDLTVTLIMGRA
jgi:glycerate 2-kinase